MNAVTGGLQRRSLIKLAGGGLAAAALAACGSPSASTSAPAGSASASANAGKKIVYSVQSFSHEALQPFVKEFTQKTGIEVELQSGPATDQDLLQQVIPAFNSGTSPYDVMDLGDPGCAALAPAGWLLPIDDALPQDVWDDLTPGMTDAMKQWNQLDGKTYRSYHNWELGYYWVRQDLVEKHGLTVPTTWDELVSVGSEFRDKTGGYGFADAASKPGLTFVYAAYIAAQAGGKIYDFDEGTKQAFQFMHDLIYKDKVFPKDAVTWTYDQLNSAYMKDELLSMREWTFFWDVAAGNKKWFDPAKIAIVAPPAGPAGNKTWAGGWGYSVPKAAKNPGAALEFVRYMSSPEVATRLAQASSFFITARKSIFSAIGDKGIVKHMKEYSEKDYVTPRPYSPQAAKAETVIDDIVQGYLTDQMDLETTLAEGRKRIADLG